MNSSIKEGVGCSDRRQALLRSPTIRVFFIIAPAGYGKTTAAKTLRAEYENTGTCDCLESNTIQSFARSVLLALAQENPAAASFFADIQTRLSSIDADAECLTILDAAWNKRPPRSLFIFENAEAIAAISPVSSLLTRLLNTTPQTRRIVVCSRVPLPTRASRYLPPHLVATVTAADLALTVAEARTILEGEGVEPSHWDEILDIARGWPIVLLLLARLSREGHLQDALSDLSSVAFEDFFVYFLSEVLAPMDEQSKLILTLCAAVPDLTVQELRAASDMSDIELEPIVRKAALIGREGERYTIHPLVREVLLQNEPDREALVLHVALIAQEHVNIRRAAQLYRVAGDFDSAAGALTALSIADLQSPENMYEMLQLPLPVIRKFAKLAACSAPHRSDLTVDVLEDVFDRLSERDDPDVVDAVAVAFSMAQYNRDGNVRRSTEILHSPLVQRAADESAAARAMLAGQEQIVAFNFGASASVEDALLRAYDLSVEARLPDNSATLADSLASLRRWKGDRAGSSQWEELALAHSRSCGTRTHARILLCAIFGAWFLGDDDSVAKYYKELGASDAQTPNGDYATVLRALDPQTIDSVLPLLWETTLCRRALVIAAGKVDGEHRQRLLTQAEESASGRARILALVLIARAASDPPQRSTICDRILTIIDPIESPELHSAVTAYRDGLPSFLDSCTARFQVTPGRAHGLAAPKGIYIQVLRECLLAEGDVLDLTPREAALLAFLSRSRSGFAREEIQEALWPDLDELRARDSLYSLLHRLRKRLDKSNIVDGIGNAYRIAGGVRVDLWDIELLSRRVQRETQAGSLDEVRRYYTMIQQREYPHLHRFDWFSPIEFRVHEHARVLARYLVEDSLNRADYDAVLTYASQLIREDPCDEWAHEVTIRAYLESQNREKAAKAYETYSTLRKREIAAEPSRRMRELASTISEPSIRIRRDNLETCR